MIDVNQEIDIDSLFKSGGTSALLSRVTAYILSCSKVRCEEHGKGQDEYRCRIFGHDCPVFSVSEPFTETKKMRILTRNIPQPTKFKVMRRDKCVCQVCGKNVSDEEINFDHIIPWSKGGSSDERNIRLLCADCNKKRGNSYESEFLISYIGEIYNFPKPLTLEMVRDLLCLTSLLKRMSLS